MTEIVTAMLRERRERPKEPADAVCALLRVLASDEAGKAQHEDAQAVADEYGLICQDPAQRAGVCERCDKPIAGAGPYCRSCLRDFDAHRVETEWTWTGPR
jgi:hypothetical protein